MIDIVLFRNILTSLNYKDYNPTLGEMRSGRFKYNKDKLDADVERILNTSIDSEDYLEGQGLPNIIPSNVIDIYTRLEILLG